MKEGSHIITNEVKEIMVDAEDDAIAFKKAIQRNITFDPKKINYARKEDANGLIIFTNYNLESNRHTSFWGEELSKKGGNHDNRRN